MVLAAQRSGAWAELEAELRDGLACVAHAAATGAPITSRKLDDAASEFRYARNLVTKDEMEAWLARWGLSAEEWSDYLRRRLLVSRWAETLADIVARHQVSRASLEPSLAAEFVCSGRFARVAEALAARAAASARARAEGWIETGVATTADRAALLDALEAGFASFREHVVTPDHLGRQLAGRQLEWIRVRYRYVTFPDAQSAREAALCVREDGMTLEDVAAAAHAAVREASAFLDALEPDLRTRCLAAAPGELLGPLADGEGALIAVLSDKVPPRLDDPRVRRRAEEEVVRRALAHEVTARVTWHLPMDT